jgi:hypothetical protein
MDNYTFIYCNETARQNHNIVVAKFKYLGTNVISQNCIQEEIQKEMSSDRIQKMILKYQPKEKRNLGRPLKRWKDSVL